MIDLEIVELVGQVQSQGAAWQLPPVKVSRVQAAGLHDFTVDIEVALLRNLSTSEQIFVRLNADTDNTLAAAGDPKSIRLSPGDVFPLGLSYYGDMTGFKLDVRSGGAVGLPAGVDRSGTIAVAATAQELAAANPDRKRLRVQNVSAGDLWVRETGAAAVDGVGSHRVTANSYYEALTNRAVSIIGATLGQRFAAYEL